MNKLLSLISLCLCVCACGTSVANRNNAVQERKLIKQHNVYEYHTNSWNTTCMLYVYDQESGNTTIQEWVGYIDEWRVDNTLWYGSNTWYEYSGNYHVLLVGTWDRA